MGYEKLIVSDPLVGYQFGIEFGGTIKGYFAEVGGIGSESEVVESKLSKDGKEIVQKTPGRLKWNDVTLNRGISDNLDIWSWRQLVVDGDLKGARRNCSILMYDRNGKVAARWDFVNAWPSKVSFRDVKADNNDFAIEEIVIVHEGMKRIKL